MALGLIKAPTSHNLNRLKSYLLTTTTEIEKGKLMFLITN
jgi:hypothetical protein